MATKGSKKRSGVIEKTQKERVRKYDRGIANESIERKDIHKVLDTLPPPKDKKKK
ncbi:hypothetical protein ACFLZL_03020 [Thermodesulfobacteriota bacterium]